MKNNLKTVKDVARNQECSNLLNNIRDRRANLLNLSDFMVTSYGPVDPTDSNTALKQTNITGRQLAKASTGSNQGKWLFKLAMYTAQKINDHIQVFELGTAAGISGMYILSGMAQIGGGYLVTFEGSPELAKLAESNLRDFIKLNALDNVDFEIVLGDLDDTLKLYIDSHNPLVHLAFIDGNHRNEPTLRYHNLLRNVMHKDGVIIHDDINWSEEMAQAWDSIQGAEGFGKTAELYMGNRPHRGVIFIDSDPHGERQIAHVDGVLLRFARMIWRIINNR